LVKLSDKSADMSFSLDIDAAANDLTVKSAAAASTANGYYSCKSWKTTTLVANGSSAKFSDL